MESPKMVYSVKSMEIHEQQTNNDTPPGQEIMSKSEAPTMKTPSTEHEAVIVKTEEGDDRKRFTRRIPTSWEEASPEDQMLITMKEAGEGWLSIRTAWEHMTGTETGSSTLPIRYSRIIAHRTHLAEGDASRLRAAKEDVEKKFLRNKWSQIALNLEKRGGKRYSPMLIQAEVGRMSHGRASDCKAVREAVLGAVLEAVDEAVDEALSKYLDETVKEDANE